MKQYTICPHCKGNGHIESEDVCISEYDAPRYHENFELIQEIVDAARAARSDHDRLCELNPRAAVSYHAQLQTVMADLEVKATALL